MILTANLVYRWGVKVMGQIRLKQNQHSLLGLISKGLYADRLFPSGVSQIR